MLFIDMKVNHVFFLYMMELENVDMCIYAMTNLGTDLYYLKRI